MRLTPRYGHPDLLELPSTVVADAVTPTLHQRERLRHLLDGLHDTQWAAPTRCEGWTVKDVVAHLTTANQLWTYSINEAAEGRPSRLLVDFDPVATPAALVDAASSLSPTETFAAYAASDDDLRTALGTVTQDDMDRPAEAPPGHLPLRAVILHALWDAWTHERDIALPLGLDAPVEPDEVTAALVYAAAIGPVLLAAAGSTRRGVLLVRATEPAVELVVEVGPTVRVQSSRGDRVAPTLTGSAVDLVEGLTFRAPLSRTIGDDDLWLLGSLGEAFEQ